VAIYIGLFRPAYRISTYFVAPVVAVDHEDDVCWSFDQYIELSFDMYYVHVLQQIVAIYRGLL